MVRSFVPSLTWQNHGLSFHAEHHNFGFAFFFFFYFLPAQLPPRRHQVQMSESPCQVNYASILRLKTFCLQDKKESINHVDPRPPPRY